VLCDVGFHEMEDRSDMVIQFLQVTSSDDPAVAQQYLDGTDWNLEAAVAHFFEGTVPQGPGMGGGGGGAGGGGRAPAHDGGFDEEGVRAALEARVDRLVDSGAGNGRSAPAGVPMPRVHAAFRDFEAERGACTDRAGGVPLIPRMQGHAECRDPRAGAGATGMAGLLWGHHSNGRAGNGSKERQP
jgi:hypothetical protein